MAARLVFSMRTILQSRGCWSRYFLTVFLDSPTSMARRTRPLGESSRPILSTKAASSAQKPHQVVQNSRRTTLPLMESLVNFSPVVVMALKRGAGSLSFGPARAQTAARIRTEKIAARNEMFFAAMVEMYTVGGSTCQLLYWQVQQNLCFPTAESQQAPIGSGNPANSVKSSNESNPMLQRAHKDRRDHARKNEIRAHPTVIDVRGSSVWAGATAGQNDYGVWTSDSLF